MIHFNLFIHHTFMLQRYLITLLCLTFSTGLQAQSNYQKATITKDDHTEVSGWIDYREWDQNPESFHFKKTPDGKVIEYTNKDISICHVNGLIRFERALVSISLDKRTMLQGYSLGPDKSSKTEVVFLKLITEGPIVSLYAYTDNIKTRYYIKDHSNDMYTELIYQKYYTDHLPPRIATNNLFRNQLQLMASKGKTASGSHFLNKLAKVEYDASSLSVIIDMINGKQAKKETAASFHLYAGLSLYRSKGVYGNSYSFLTEGATTKTSYLPKLSVGADLFNNGYTKRFIYRLDLSLSMANQGISKTGENNKVSGHSYKQYTATLTPQFICNLYNGLHIQANIGTGFAANLSFYDNSPVAISNSIYYREEKMVLRPFWLSLPVRAGIIVKRKVDIYGQYTFGSALHRAGSYFSLRCDAWQVGANILFW